MDGFYSTLTQAFQDIPELHYQRSEYAFTRGGVLTPELLTTFLLYMVADGNRRGIRHLLPDFWEHAHDHGLVLSRDSPVSAAAICQARAQLHSDLFRGLLTNLSSPRIDGAQAQGRLWRGRRVLAVDGAKLNLRRSPDLSGSFGVPEGAHCPQVLMSTLVDVCLRMPVDFEVSGYRGAERDHLLRLLNSVEPGDLLILDRGYPSHAVLQACSKAEIDFLVRVPSSQTFSAVDEFRKSGATDTIVTLKLPENAEPDWIPLQVRLTRIAGPAGPAFYVSSLERAKVSVQDIRELYHMRWEAEEAGGRLL